jgi:hypothetical protein
MADRRSEPRGRRGGMAKNAIAIGTSARPSSPTGSALSLAAFIVLSGDGRLPTSPGRDAQYFRA